MEASSIPNSRLVRFWRAWRREIVRGALMFAAVVGIGFFAMHFFGTFASGWGGGGDWDDFADRFGNGDHSDRQETFHYAAVLAPGQKVWIRNRSGEVTIEAAEDESLTVEAVKTWHRSGPETVEIMAVPHEGGVTICAVWEAAASRCDPEAEYGLTDLRHTDVNVQFTVHVPRGVAIDASTVNGELEVMDVEAPVTTKTFNGKIHAHVLQAPFSATTVNGEIDVNLGFPNGRRGGEVSLATVNGSIMAAILRGLNANLEAKTVNGKVESELPVRITGTFTSKQVVGRLGSGGPRLQVSTVNGSIQLTELEPDPDMHPVAHPELEVPEVPPVPAVPAVPATPVVPKKHRSRVAP